MWSLILKAVASGLVGIGLMDVADKFVKPKVPEYYPETVSPGWKPLKLVWILAAFALAFIVLKWIARKFKISFLR